MIHYLSVKYKKMQQTKLHDIMVRGLDKSEWHYIKAKATKNGRSVSKEIIKLIQTSKISDPIKSTEKIKV